MSSPKRGLIFETGFKQPPSTGAYQTAPQRVPHISSTLIVIFPLKFFGMPPIAVESEAGRWYRSAGTPKLSWWIKKAPSHDDKLVSLVTRGSPSPPTIDASTMKHSGCAGRASSMVKELALRPQNVCERYCNIPILCRACSIAIQVNSYILFWRSVISQRTIISR